MSTSLLYHAFGIRGYNHVNTQFIGGDVFFWVLVSVATIMLTLSSLEVMCSSGLKKKPKTSDALFVDLVMFHEEA